jgi:hypothetical protein
VAYNNRAFAKLESRDQKGACSDWEKAVKLGFTGAKGNLNKYCK